MKILHIFAQTIFISLLVVGCSNESSDTWYNNPKKIVVSKPGETLTDVSKRLMSKRIDSLGIALDKDRSAYQSGPLMLEGLFNEPGHPIVDISQNCNGKNLLDGGDLFGGIDCKSNSISQLISLSKDTKSGIQEICAPVSVDSEQEVQGYSNVGKKVYWRTSGEKLFSIGVYRDEISGAEYVLLPCDLNARNAWKVAEAKRIEDEKKWYVQDGIGGIKIDSCKESEGPPAMIKMLQTLNQPIETTDEIKDSSGNIVETTFIIRSKNAAIRYFRGKARCEQSIAKEKKENKNTLDKYK